MELPLDPTIRGIIFDAVGTIIDPSPSVSEVYAEAGRRQGVLLSLGEVKQRFRQAFTRQEQCEGQGALATDEKTELRRWRRIVDECLPEVSDPDLAFRELWDHFGKPDSWQVFPEASFTMKLLESAGYTVFVASNFDSRLRLVLRGQDELAGWADTAVISSEIGWRKPHPNFYKITCKRMGLDPSLVLCVGDDVENDAIGPRKVGLSAVLVDRKDSLPGERHRLQRLDELLEILLPRESVGPVPIEKLLI